MDRYDLDKGSPMRHVGPSMEETEDGDWVRWEDVEQLQKENERLEKLEADFKKLWCYDPDYCKQILAEEK